MWHLYLIKIILEQSLVGVTNRPAYNEKYAINLLSFKHSDLLIKTGLYTKLCCELSNFFV